MTLLQPRANHFKIVSGAGAWALRHAQPGATFYAAVLEGSYELEVDGQAPATAGAGDFLLVPSALGFRVSSGAAPPTEPVEIAPGEYRMGASDAPADVRFLVGHCAFGASDAGLLVSLLPALIHVRGQARLTTLVELVGEESRARRPAREIILARLVELLFIEALRSSSSVPASRGLVRALADPHLAAAIRCLHAHPARGWTVASLAREAGLSRSGFAERFAAAVGMAPMEYLLAWRMALAKRLLDGGARGIAEVAGAVGYSSASTFSVAFTRVTRMTPSQFARRAPQGAQARVAFDAA